MVCYYQVPGLRLEQSDKGHALRAIYIQIQDQGYTMPSNAPPMLLYISIASIIYSSHLAPCLGMFLLPESHVRVLPLPISVFVDLTPSIAPET